MNEHFNRPSKQFLKRGAIAIGIVAIVLIVQTQWFKHLFNKKSHTAITTTTVAGLVGGDSNGNGIADWEERLWGLDPTVLYTNGTPNATIIEQKKQALGISTSTTDTDLNDTDRVARDLFTLTAALGQSDEIDQATLQRIASQLGNSIDIKQVANQYSVKDIETVPTSLANLTQYKKDMQRILSKYNINTPDIEVLATALQNEDTTNLPQLVQSATSYRTLARELSRVKTPVGLAQDQVSIINGFAGIATAFTFITELDNNTLKALVGVSVYKTYATKLDTGLSGMNAYLTQYGIL